MTTTYVPKYKATQLKYGDNSDLVIVTGWTKIENIEKAIADPSLYAGIGNLYSVTSGVDILIRNLILNPQINRLYHLFLTPLDNNAGLRNLSDFFAYGVVDGYTESGIPSWVINSNCPKRGYLSKSIPIEYLNNIRTRIDYKMISNLNDLRFYLKSEAKSHYVSPVPALAPIDFPLPVENDVIRRGVSNGHLIRGKTVAECWVESISRIRTQGFKQPTGYEGKVQGITNLTTVITDEGIDLDSFHIPDYVPTNKEYMAGYIPYVCEDNSDPLVRYTYGSRLISHFGHDQIQEVVNKIIQEPISSSAVMTLWDAGSPDKKSDNQNGGSPCLNHIMVQICENKLTLSALFRSQDTFMAYVPNTLALRALQVKIWLKLKEILTDLEIGDLTSTARWGHIYEESFQFADSTLKKIHIGGNPDYTDPVGNFNITLDTDPNNDDKGRLIICTEQMIDGQVISYRGHNPLQLIRWISRDNPNIQPDHIGYLGIELQKAYDCLKSNQTYRMS